MFNLGILLLFVIFNIFWYQVPGQLFSMLLMPRSMRASSRLLAGYFLGFTVMAAIYMVESLTGIPYLLAAAGPIFSVATLLYWLKRGKRSVLNAGEHIRPTHIIIFVIIYLVSFLSFQFWYARACSGITTQVYHDFLYHTGNIISLSRSFPNFDIRVDGVMFYYHYFMELIYAMCKHVFGMDAFTLYMNGNCLVCAWPLTLALASLGDRLVGNRQIAEKRYFFYCFGTMLSCIAIYPAIVVGARFPISWTDNHLFGNGNALGLCVSLTILYLDVIVEVWYKSFSKRSLVLVTLLMVALTGFKGNAGIAMAAITVAVFVIESIIIKRVSKHRLAYTIASVVAFVATYLVVDVGVAVQGSNNRTTVVSPQGSLDFSRVGEFIERVLHQDYMAFPWIVIAIPLCAIVIVGPLFIPMLGWFIKKFKGLFATWQIGDVYDWFAIGSIIIAILAYSFITIEGLSQGYMIIGVAPLIFYGVIRYIEGGAARIFRNYSLAIWAIGALFLALDISWYCYAGVQQNAKYAVEAGDADDLVSHDTMEAYFWIRDNTEEDALVAVDRHTESLDWRQIYFYCSAFSERQCYIEGYDYTDVDETVSDAMMEINDMFYSEDSMEADAAMEMQGIDYLVVTKHSHPDYVCTSPRLELKFENEEVRVYRFW